jgi:hypothetical protein
MARTSVSLSIPSDANCPADLGPEIQRALAALADVETRYEVECEQMERWTGPVAWKDRVRAGIEARHMRDRQPIVQRLADLQREMTAALMFGRPQRH